MEKVDGEEKQVVSRFGDDAISAFYARLKTVSTENEVLKLYELQIDEKEVRIVIANSWMVVRDLASNAIKAFERDYTNALWYRVESATILSAVPVWPVRNLPEHATTPFVSAILRKLYEAAGGAAVEEDVISRHQDRWDRITQEHDREYKEKTGRYPHEAPVIADPGPSTVGRAKAWFATRLFGDLHGRGRPSRKPRGGYVSRSSVYNAIKGIRTAFHRHFREPELFRAILSMDHRAMSLSDYVYYGGNREGVLKVWNERKNLIPMLPFIKRGFWGDDNLFSADWWTSPSGPLATPGFKETDGRWMPSRFLGVGTFSPFGDRKAFKWLTRSKNSVVKSWVRYGKSPLIAELMSELNLPKNTPARIQAHVVTELHGRLSQLENFGVELADVRAGVLNAFRAYAGHFVEIRNERRYRDAMNEFFNGHGRGTGEVFDYLINEGFLNGIPARNATWASLLRRSGEWHAVNGYRLSFGDDDVDDSVTWDSIIGEAEVLGCKVKAIVKAGDLRLEGSRMRHCVRTYAPLCARDTYRVFSLVEDDGTASTLGLYVGAEGARFDQLQGFANSQASASAMRAARKVVQMYNEAVAGGQGVKQAA